MKPLYPKEVVAIPEFAVFPVRLPAGEGAALRDDDASNAGFRDDDLGGY